MIPEPGFGVARGIGVVVRVPGGVVALRGTAPAELPLSGQTLMPFLAAGPRVWDRAQDWLGGGVSGPVIPDPDLVLPFEVADYVDFYSSRHHAENVGAILRPGQPALPAAWTHLPIGYHGRAGTVVVSGTAVRRPRGQLSAGVVGATARLDVEVELGFVVGVPSTLGTPVPIDEWRQHVFGLVVLNDWSARDIQAFEYVPLGPFLGKSFATSISPWVVPLSALEDARLPPEPTTVADYLTGADHPCGSNTGGYDIALELSVNGHVVARPPFSAMGWTPAQQLAHLTVNGASLRTGDLYGSGTISGAAEPGGPARVGSLLELTHNGTVAIGMPDGSELGYLRDGDTVAIRATAAGLDLGTVTGTVLPANG